MRRLPLFIFLCLSSFAAAELENWSPISVPESQGWNEQKTFVWYRAYVHVPKSWEGSRLLLMTESISDVDEAFINGEKVGANGSMPPLFGNPSSGIRRPFVVEPDQIHFGSPNLIAWRVYNNKGQGGLLKGPIHLTRTNDAIDLSGTWLRRQGDVPAWANWLTPDPLKEAATFRKLAGEQAAGHRGVIPADVEGRKRMLAAVAKGFEGNKNSYARADDKGNPTPAEEAVKQFQLGEGLALDLVLSEPLVRQPLYLDFDERGRLWVVQYIQYPNPAGLEVLTWDRHLRKVFDQVPPPPPFDQPAQQKFRGLDKITIHEDTNGDGIFDHHKTFLDGLNMVTSVAPGKEGVWVLHPPYLLFYPDKNGDDIPDSKPIVHLSGFNLEDTHSISNSLKFGPDGWLYGCTGSTVTARVRVHLQKDQPRYPFLGQNIWRYHPTKHRFELYAEGGWNNFGVDFDAKGRLYSGTNGNMQAVHFVQGGYYQKNFGKHGPHTNPYTFGHFFGIPVQGERIRLVHQWIRYESGALPSLEGHFVGVNSLGNTIHSLQATPQGSTFTSKEDPRPLSTKDKWFRPIHCTVGPDGAVYIADFYDARITHVDPRDNWDRSNGRVYRLRATDGKPAVRDLTKLSRKDLLRTLSDPNQWARRTAQRLLSQARPEDANDILKQLRKREDPQLAIETVWLAHAWNDQESLFASLDHTDPHVRTWAIRLLVDEASSKLSNEIVTRLQELAEKEEHPIVISQLFSSTQRMTPSDAVRLLPVLNQRSQFSDDPFIPQQYWWALEALCTRSPETATELLGYQSFWNSDLFKKVVRERIGRRFMAERSAASLEACAFLLQAAAGTEHLDPLIRGMERALEGSELDPVPASLDKALATLWKEQKVSNDLIRFSLRLRSPQALTAARPLVADPKAPREQRLALLKALSELQDASSKGVFLTLFSNQKEDPALRLAALSALRRYAGPDISATVLRILPRLQGDLELTALSLLASRPQSALKLLEAVDRKTIAKERLPLNDLLLIATHKNKECDRLIAKHWGTLHQPSEAKAKRIAAIKKLLTAGKGNAPAGRTVFAEKCSACHKFVDQGRDIGPDLTGYEMKNLDYLLPAIVDPNLGIREGFELATLTLRAEEGQAPAVLTGFISDANNRSLTIKDLAGNQTVIARKDLANETRAAVSVMPEGLLDSMRDQQVRDLIAYLQKPGKK